MVRVLRRLRQLRHVDVIGPLGKAWVDVSAWGAVGLLQLGMLAFKAREEGAGRVGERGGRERSKQGGGKDGGGRENKYVQATGT